jgi:molecular chaperone GrpE
MTEPLPTEPNDTTQTGPAEAAGLAEQLAAARLEVAAGYDRYTRAVADLDNFRKRAIREKDELRQFAASGLMEDIIPILDNLALGLAAARQQPEGKSIIDGVALVLEQLKTTLTRHGLKEIDPAGQLFDPNFHDCIAHQPSEEFAEEHVMQVVRLGYSLNGRLLRPASVIVSKGSPKEANV